MKYTKNLMKLKSLKEARLRLARQHLLVAKVEETGAQKASDDAENAYESKKSDAYNFTQNALTELRSEETITNYLSSLSFDHNRLRQEVSMLGKVVLESRSAKQEAITKRAEAGKFHLNMEMKSKYFAAYANRKAARMQEAVEDAFEEDVVETLAGRIYDA